MVADLEWDQFARLDNKLAHNWLRYATKVQLRFTLSDKINTLDYDAFRDDGKGTAQALCEVYIEGYPGRPVMKMNKAELREELTALYRFYQLLVWKAALRMECRGMRRRGRSVYSIVKQQLGFSGNKHKVLTQLEAYIETKQREREAEDGGQR